MRGHGWLQFTVFAKIGRGKSRWKARFCLWAGSQTPKPDNPRALPALKYRVWHCHTPFYPHRCACPRLQPSSSIGGAVFPWKYNQSCYCWSLNFSRKYQFPCILDQGTCTHYRTGWLLVPQALCPSFSRAPGGALSSPTLERTGRPLGFRVYSGR